VKKFSVIRDSFLVLSCKVEAKQWQWVSRALGLPEFIPAEAFPVQSIEVAIWRGEWGALR
jgi:hypothetical protein